MKKQLLILLLVIQGITFAQSTTYVILVSFDGFRWDYVNRDITPNLQAMKNDGVSALSLRPTFPSKTFPNHQAIITGMYNDHHGIISNFFENPFTHETYRMGDTNSIRDGKWYLGEFFWETAERHGIITASYFWPGSELTNSHRRPTYYKFYEHNKPYRERIIEAVDWLKLPDAERPHFITIYFHDTDSYGHDYGPNSPEINKSIQRLDSLVGFLHNQLSTTDLSDSVNVIIVSDHGMTEISEERTINIAEMLRDYDCTFNGGGPFMMINCEQNNQEEIFNLLKKNSDNYRVYLKENLPEYYHYKDHPFIYPIILVAEKGWSLLDERAVKRNSYSSGGNHGYEKDLLDMHGVFIADGPSFRDGFQTGTLWNIDIYPLLCKIFEISPRQNIDGKSERIEFLLKEKK
ncbi:MAG: ectonucleotide pyrophosphatase/phosphodiesterase [Melioribacteraceae bacterium]|nr:ectonucleotide pyrophosphatase/phosphodiesterase [Melioribacteraceae bacterium]MCF8355667.1 ectonucleotide pyrophosphatase/phosphodiesterase [Melioribacteraceae bacterium]MCF8395131.1 ectonucleotide pyrophosphatase/phosphodiesterase [Melioribacteraceae bacterium]MCF8420575.1 ectonucleotide pyrophosphatase/phosphodiesterase [Melioribacteraceae bacterium]